MHWGAFHAILLLRSFDNTTKREVGHETSTMGTVLRHHTGAVPRGYCGGADPRTRRRPQRRKPVTSTKMRGRAMAFASHTVRRRTAISSSQERNRAATASASILLTTLCGQAIASVRRRGKHRRSRARFQRARRKISSSARGCRDSVPRAMGPVSWSAPGSSSPSLTGNHYVWRRLGVIRSASL